jgi:hypothetical protein
MPSTIFATAAEHVARLRHEEQEARAAGEFETAVQRQQAADNIEGHGLTSTAEFRMCSWWQRGRDRIPYWTTINGLIGIEAPNGFIHCMTEDIAYYVLMILLTHLKIDTVVAGYDGWSFTKTERSLTKDPE